MMQTTEVSEVNQPFNLAIGKLSRDDMASCSTLPAISGLSPWASPNNVLRRATDAVEGKPREEYSVGEAADWGNRLENIILGEAAQRLGLSIDAHITERVEHPHLPLQGSLDGVLAGDGRTVTHDPDTGIYVLGGKSIQLIGPGVAEAKLTGAPPTDDPPVYRGPLQVQGLMMCASYQWGAIATLYRGTELRIYLVSPDAYLVAKIESDVREFERRVELFRTDGVTDWYPALTPNDAAQTYPTGEEDLPPIRLSGSANNAAIDLMTAKDALKTVQKKIDQATVVVMDALGIHSRALVQEDGQIIAEIGWPMLKPRGEYLVGARPAGRGKSLRIKRVEGQL